MYGFGEVVGDIVFLCIISLGSNYVQGDFGLGVVYIDVCYFFMGNGYDGICNWGLGVCYWLGDYKFNLFYINMCNILIKGEVNVYQVGVNWQMDVVWNLGVFYEYMKGNV